MNKKKGIKPKDKSPSNLINSKLLERNVQMEVAKEFIKNSKKNDSNKKI